jgi:pentatricopeptide repeat protein
MIIRLDEYMRISKQSLYLFFSRLPILVSWSFLPSPEGSNGVEGAIELFDMMNQTDIPKTVLTYNTVISACARSREVGMRKDGIRPDVVSFNSVIGACANTARWKDALTVLDQCYRELGVTANIYTYTNVMRYVLLYKQQRREFNQFILVSVPGSCSLSIVSKNLQRACVKGGETKRALNMLQVVKDTIVITIGCDLFYFG